ncbi:TauD/TfdA dioxygenase family protein [Photorhabdus sp. SF281]|uniref:TauD/TfdA dioxygenase family protein n=1 Tax=Photorhabdus sp. SF281 TaxID=3459527 RepID=UPI004044AD7B
MTDLNKFQTEEMMPFGLKITPQYAGQHIDTLSVEELKPLIKKHHLLILRGFKSGLSDHEIYEDYARDWGEIMMWPFGAVLDVREHQDATDHVFDNTYMPLHWDGMYKPTIPEFIMFHCAHAPDSDQGGRTTFVNTRLVVANATQQQLEQWKDISVTYRINKVTHYGGEVHSPLLEKHPDGNGFVIRYNEPAIDGEKFLNKHAIEYHNINPDQVAEFQQDFINTLYDKRHLYAHAWQKGDLVIVDNFSLLHGREGFTAKSERHLQRIHIQSDPVFNNQALIM